MATAKLRKFCMNEGSPTQTYSTTIIVVPDISGRPPLSWQLESETWLSSLVPSLIVDPYLLEYSYSYDTFKSFSWKQYLSEGDCLLKQLINAVTEEPPFLRRPLVFICHGFGGFIVKQAVLKLLERYNDKTHHGVKAALQGVIFLGCPHIAPEPKRLALLLKACTGLSDRQLAQIQSDVAPVYQLARHFKELALDISIVSAFESLPTKLSGSVLGSKKEILVDEDFAEIGTKGEVLIRTKANHFTICDLDKSDALYKGILKFLSEHSIRSPLSAQALSHFDDAESYGVWQGTNSEYDVVDAQLSSSGGHYNSLQVAEASTDASGYEVVPSMAARLNINEPPKEFHLPCHMLDAHPRNKGFYGREEILQLLDQALIPKTQIQSEQPSTSLTTFALCGMGGVGKTQIAVEFAYRSKNRFDAIFFLQAADTIKLAQGYANISLELGLESAKEATDQTISKARVLEWLSNPRKKQNEENDHAEKVDTGDNEQTTWLLILDNADKLEILFDYWPLGGNGSVLITSRDQLAKTKSYIPVTRGYDLDPFTAEDAASLLRSITGYNSTAEDLKSSLAIGQRLGGLPLAITQIANTIIRRDLTFADFLALCEEDAERQNLYQDVSDGTEKTIYTTWAFNDLSKHATFLLDVLSMLDPDGITEDLLTTFGPRAGVSGPRIDNFPITLANYTAARLELTRSSLVRRNANKDITIHRLVQDTVHFRMDATRRNLVLKVVIEILYRAWPFGINDHSTARWKKCEPIFPHINFVRQYCELCPNEDLGDTAERFGRLLADAGWYYLERGNALGCLPFQQLAQRVLESLPTVDIIRLAEVHQARSEVCVDSGQIEESLQHAWRALELCEEAEDPGHRLGQAHNQVAQLLCYKKEFATAIEHCDKARAWYLQTEGEYEHLESTAFSMLHKTFCYWRMGRLDEASAICEEMLEYRRARYGPNDTVSHKTGFFLEFLGNVRQHQSRYDEALDLHLQALEQFKVSRGLSTIRVAMVTFRLSQHAVRSGDYVEADERLREVIRIYKLRVEFKAELTRAWFELVKVLEILGNEDGLRMARLQAASLLAELGRAKGKVLKPEDVVNYVQIYSLT